MKRILLNIVAMALCATMVQAADPTATNYTMRECEGSYMPYPDVKSVEACPDSLEPVMINHIGRHGVRFPSSEKNIKAVLEAVARAEAAGQLTSTGRKLRNLCNTIKAATAGRWGALDSLGETEQAAIATRMAKAWPTLFDGGRVEAIASYSPRAIMSMYCFTHRLARINNKLEIYTSSGRQNSKLLRPFDSDTFYHEYREEGRWREPLTALETQVLTDAPLKRAFGSTFDGADPSEMRELVMNEYSVVACAAAAGVETDASEFFTRDEYNAAWSVSNLRHYLQYSASTLSMAPVDMAADLLRELIDTTGDNGNCHVRLRFGHAETLMPLLAMMHIPGCYYMTNYFDTVAMHWRDFNIVPMAANLQLILLRHKQNGRLYLRVDLNEKPVPLIPARTAIYTPWEVAREYLTRCLPLLYQ